MVSWKKEEETFGEHLRKLRERENKSLDELAMLTGIASWLLQRYERDLEIPKRPVVHGISRALGCDAFWLLRWREGALRKRRASGK